MKIAYLQKVSVALCAELAIRKLKYIL